VECTTCVSLIGFVVGALIGLTGLGGGVLLLPLLIYGVQTPPLVAIGSGAAFSALTKVSAAVVHWRQGNVDWALAGAMAVGSVPGALAGVAILGYLRSRYGEGVNDLLMTLIGVLLVTVPLLLVFQHRLERSGGISFREYLPRWLNRYNGAFFIGIEGGLLVGLTSVGAGSVIILLLLLFYRLTPQVLVGTDIVHAVILTGVTGIAHLGLGTVDFGLVGWLIVGSMPGVLIGSALTRVVSGSRIRGVLLVVLLTTGLSMLGALNFIIDGP